MRLILAFLFILISVIIFVSSLAHGRDGQEMCMYFNDTQIKCELLQIKYEDGVLSIFDKEGNEETFKVGKKQEKLYYFSYPFYDVEMRLRNRIIESRSGKEDKWKNVRDDEEGK